MKEISQKIEQNKKMKSKREQTKRQIENLFSKFNIQTAGISERGKKEK